jgi:hypothetical protein
MSVNRYPVVFVNEVAVWGGYTPPTVLGYICDGYAPDAQPAACECKSSLGDAYDSCVRHGGRAGGGGHGGGDAAADGSVAWWAARVAGVERR